MQERRADFKMTAAGGPSERQIVRAVGSIGMATLTSRVLGFVRDMVVALVFGAGPVTDAFFVAFRIPNILRRLLAEGALSTAIIPVFTDYFVNRTREDFLRMLRAVFVLALVALGAVTLAGIVLAPWIVRAIAPGFATGGSQLDVAVLLTRVMFPYLPLVGLAALAMGALNCQNRFFAAALGPAVLNVGMIVGVVALHRRLEPAILSLALGVLLGGVGQLLVQVPSLARCGSLVAPSTELGHPALGRLTRLLLPAVFGLAAVQVMVFINTLLASLLPGGSISFLYYADRVMEFPLGVFGIALASASLPVMARQAAAGDRRGVGETLNFALRLSFFVSVPATVGLVMLRAPITRVLFERGQFHADDTAATAAALAGYAVGLAGFSGSRIAAQAFYAVGEPGRAVKLGILAIAANALAAVALMRPLGHVGLALASSIGAFVNLAALAQAARGRFGPLGGRRIAASLGRTLVASVPLGAWCALATWTWPVRGGVWLDVAWLAVAVGGGAALFWIASALVRAPERTELLRTLPGRERR
jgi:putative peptidoglycan lipid II flippase